jgi:hypothetical protein
MRYISHKLNVRFLIGRFFETNNYFGDALKFYERGVELFSYPIAFDRFLPGKCVFSPV